MPILRHLDTDAAIGALTRLGDPYVLLVAMFLVILLERDEVWVFQPLLDMESDRERVEGILTDGLIIVFHIDKERLLVAKMVIIFDFIGKLDRVSLERLLSSVLRLANFLALFSRQCGWRLDDWLFLWRGSCDRGNINFALLGGR